MNRSSRAPWFGQFAQRLIVDVLTHVLIATCAGTVLFLVVDFVEVGNRAKDTATAADFASLSLYSIPAIMKLIMPVSAPIGTLTAVGTQMRQLEVAAIFAAGARPTVFLKPLLICGLIIASLYAANIEFIVPISSTKTNVIRRRIGLPYANTLWGRDGWYKGKHRLYRVRTIAKSDGSQLKEVLMLDIKSGKITERTDVNTLSFASGSWTGEGIVRRSLHVPSLEKQRDDLAVGSASMKTARYDRKGLTVPEKPKDFNTGLAVPHRLPYSALKESTAIRERLGRPAFKHRLELYARHTGPLSLLIVILLAAALSLRNGRKQSLASALGIGAGLGFSLWLTREIAQLVGATGAFPTWSTAHMLPLILATAALVAWSLVGRRGIRES